MSVRMDVIGIENSLVKLKAYGLREKNNFDDIMNRCELLIQNYSSKNNSISKIKFDNLENKFNTIEKIHNNNQFVINYYLKKYIETNKKVSQIFKDIK